MIKDNDVTPLISIDQINPIYVTFAIPEQYLGEVVKCSKQAALKVKAFIEGEKLPEDGQVTFIDNQVDTTTGTINLKALFKTQIGACGGGSLSTSFLCLRKSRTWF